MKKFYFLRALTASIVILFAGCSKNDNDGMPNPEKENPVVEEVALGEHTVELSEIQKQNILSVQDGILALNSSLASSELPQEGQILLQSEPTEKLPYGFMGRVIRVEKADGNYRIKTEPVPLSEAFEVLKIDKTIDLVPTEMQTRSGILPERDEDGFLMIPLSINVSHDDPPSSISFSGTLRLGVQMRVKTDIDRAVSSNGADIEIDVKFGVDVDSKNEINGKNEYTMNIGSPIPLSPLFSKIIISPELQLKAIAECVGSVSLQMGFSLEKRFKQTIQLRGNTHHVKIEEVKDPGKCQSKPFAANCSIDGSIFCGFGTEFLLRMFNSDLVKVSAEPQFGSELSGNFTINYGQEDLYQTLRDTKIKQSLRCKAEVKANLLGSKWKWSMPLWDNPLLEKELYLFPEFNNSKVEIGKVGQAVSMSVERDLLFPSSVGVALYQGNTRIATSDAVPYFVEEEFANPLVASFPGLSDNTDYVAWSYVRWGDLFIKAAKLNQSPSIIGKWLAVHREWEEKFWSDDPDNRDLKTETGSEDISSIGYIIEFHENGTWRVVDEASGTWKATDENSFTLQDPENPKSRFSGSVVKMDSGEILLNITERVSEPNYSLWSVVKYRKIEAVR